MTLVSLVGEADAEDVDIPALQGGMKAYGQVLNTWGAILNSPGMFASYLPFLRRVNGPGELDDRIKELAAIRIAVLNHCRYTLSHRYTSATGKGYPDEDLRAVASGDFSKFSERERTAYRVAEELTLAPPVTSRDQHPTGLPSDLLKEAKRQFSDRELVELLMSISMWNALTRFHRVMDFDLDMQPPPEEIDALL